MSKTHKPPSGPGTIAALLHWRKGPALGGTEQPKLGEELLVEFGNDPSFAMFEVVSPNGRYRVRIRETDRDVLIAWSEVRYWIPWDEIRPAGEKRHG